MKNLTDEQIISEIASGKFDYTGLLFDRYSKQLLNYFFRSTGNFDDSKDLTQEVFIKIFKYAHSFRLDTSFKFWLFKIASNLLNTYYSNKQKHFSHHDKIAYQLEKPDYEDNQVAEDKMLFDAISKLPEEYRELIILSRFAKFKYSEIAEMYQTTEASIKNKLYRALMKLREIYFEDTKTERI